MDDSKNPEEMAAAPAEDAANSNLEEEAGTPPEARIAQLEAELDDSTFDGSDGSSDDGGGYDDV